MEPYDTRSNGATFQKRIRAYPTNPRSGEDRSKRSSIGKTGFV